MKKRKRKKETKVGDEVDDDISSENITTYCCSLNQIFKQYVSKEMKGKFKKEVDRLVLTMARLRHEASYLANYIILQQCEFETTDLNNVNPVNKTKLFLQDHAAWTEFYRSCMGVILNKKMGSTMVANFKTKQETQKNQIQELDNLDFEQKMIQMEFADSVPNPIDSENINKTLKYFINTDVPLNLSEEKEELLLDYKEKKENYKKLKEEEKKVIISLDKYKLKFDNTAYFNDLIGKWPTSDFDYTTNLKGYSSSKDIVAIEMATNAINSIKLNVRKRQKSTLCLEFPPALVYKMMVLINCPEEKMDSYMKNWQTRLKKKQRQDKKKLEGESKSNTNSKKRIRKTRNKAMQILKEIKTEKIQSIIRTHRFILRDHQPELEEKGVNQYYAEDHLWRILKYYYFLLQTVEDVRNKRLKESTDKDEKKVTQIPPEKSFGGRKHFQKLKFFHLLPLHDYSRFCISIQRKVFFEILTHIRYNKKGCKMKDLKSQKDYALWEEWFSFDHLRLPKNRTLTFKHNLVTDGVKVSVLYINSDCKNQEWSKENSKKGKKKQKEERESTNKKNKKGKKQKKNSKKEAPPIKKIKQMIAPGTHGMYNDSDIELNPFLPYIKVAVDPGRNPVSAVLSKSSHYESESLNLETNAVNHIQNPMDYRLNRDEFRIFSSGEFHQSRGTNRAKKILNNHKELFCKESKEKEQALLSMSKDCFKTRNSEDFKLTWINRLQYEDTLWNFYGLKMFRKWKFKSYQKKQRTERQICLRILGLTSNTFKSVCDANKILRNQMPIVVAYGNGKFSTNIKGNNATPVVTIAKKLSHFPNVTVIMADEFRTSQRCCACYSILKKKKLYSWQKTKQFQPKYKRKNGKLIYSYRPIYERVHRRCFKVLTCSTQGCINAKGIDRDVNACANILENTRRLMNGKEKEKIFTRSEDYENELKYAQA